MPVDCLICKKEQNFLVCMECREKGVNKVRPMVVCECMTEGIVLDLDEETNLLDLAFWRQGHDRGYGSRWHWIKQILRYGHPFVDMVELDKSKLQKLIAELQAIESVMKPLEPGLKYDLGKITEV